MTIPTRHKATLSSVIRTAHQTICDHPNTEKYRFFAATRGQILDQDPDLGIKMHPCWFLLRSNFDQTGGTGKTWLEFQPLSPNAAQPYYSDKPFPLPVRLSQAFLDMMTDDRHIFGGETIVYEKGNEPIITGKIFESEAAIEACLHAPKGIKSIQPVELDVFEYDTGLVVNGPEEFFLPDSLCSVDHGFFSEDGRPLSNFAELPVWATPPHDDTDDTDWSDTYSTLLDIANDPSTLITKAVLIPTLWRPGILSLDFQSDWKVDAQGYVWTSIGPFNVEHAITDIDKNTLETCIYYNP